MTEETTVTLEEMEELLVTREAMVAEPGNLKPAAVALLVRHGRDGLEILYILRAESAHDPWSGNIGFPWGRIESNDASAKAAAERETLEEVGIDLTTGRYLGRLDDLVGMTLPVVVSCFVYIVPPDTSLTLSAEVAETFWISLAHLSDSRQHCRREFLFGGQNYNKPAITILPAPKPVLWGLTYRLTMQLLILLGYDVPVDPDETE